VPRIERHATVTWEGTLSRGAGKITAGTGAFKDLDYSLPARIGAGDEPKTSPEELLAAAHAGCLASGIAGELSRAKTPPEHLDVTANVVMDEVEGKGHVIVASQVRVRARVPGIDGDTFGKAVEVADEGCPFSLLIRATAKVTIDAELED
jgi:osmotically inducible protein OsmC